MFSTPGPLCGTNYTNHEIPTNCKIFQTSYSLYEISVDGREILSCLLKDEFLFTNANSFCLEFYH